MLQSRQASQSGITHDSVDGRPPLDLGPPGGLHCNGDITAAIGARPPVVHGGRPPTAGLLPRFDGAPVDAPGGFGERSFYLWEIALPP
jgi:hypothetical protein